MFRLPSSDYLAQVLRAAVHLDDAIGGLVQRVEEHGRQLRVVEYYGLTLEYFERFKTVDFGMSTACSQAVIERRRIVIRDVRTDAAFAPFAEDAVRAGYLAVQSTPLIDSQFRAIGVLSTYFPHPHHPGPASIELIESYARIAALLLETESLQLALVDADRRLSIPARALSNAAAEAAGTAHRLLSSFDHTKSEKDISVLCRHLELLVKELRAGLHQSKSFAARTAAAAD